MEDSKKSGKGLVVLVIFLIILLLGSIAYICYDKGVFDKFFDKDKQNKEEDTTYEYRIIYSEGDPDILIVKKDGKWYERDSYNVEAGGSSASLIGEKDGKLYYIMNKAIKYIDLKSEDQKPSVLVASSDKNSCRDNINHGSIVGDRIYFELAVSCHESKLSSISINDSSLDNAKEEVDFVNDYKVIEGDIYYTVGWNCSDYVFSKKNIETGKITKIGEGICAFDLENDNSIIYYLDANKYDYETGTTYYGETTGCYEYDIKTEKSKKIDIITNKIKDMDIDFYKGNIYYVSDNKLIKYENDSIKELYSQVKTDEYGNQTIIQMPTVITDNAVILDEQYLTKDEDNSFAISDENTIVILDGKKNNEKQARSVLEAYSVNMIDGSVKNFSIMDTIH